MASNPPTKNPALSAGRTTSQCLPREPQQAENAAADSVQNARGDRCESGDGVVRAAQFAESPLERFGNVNVGGDLDELVAGDRKPQSEARVAELFGALIDESVIDAAAGTRLLRLLEQRVWFEVDIPVGRRALFGERARRRRIERFRRLVPHIRFRNAVSETVGRAAGLESDHDFFDFAGLEDPHVPPVRRIEIAADQSGERVLSSAFELDVVLRVVVVREAHRALRTVRGEMQLCRDVAGPRERLARGSS